MYHFPRTKHVDTASPYEQLQHIKSEMAELERAYLHEPKDRVAEEALDLIHSAETFLRILQERQGIDIESIQRRVIDKNRQRGYYAELAPAAPDAAHQLYTEGPNSIWIFPYTDLNGWRLVSEEPPPFFNAVPCLLGYVTDRHPLSAIMYGMGHRDCEYCYWLGPRGIDPHYTRLENWQVLIWHPVELPYTYDDNRKGNTYVQIRNILSLNPKGGDAMT